MSYKQAMKWQRKHPKGTRQPVLMSTNSGFWPSGAFLETYFEYRKECETEGKKPLSCEEYYKSKL